MSLLENHSFPTTKNWGMPSIDLQGVLYELRELVEACGGSAHNDQARNDIQNLAEKLLNSKIIRILPRELDTTNDESAKNLLKELRSKIPEDKSILLTITDYKRNATCEVEVLK